MADFYDADSDRACPLCMEELDETDRNFFPCECGYQVCLWCLHYIRDNMTNQCPACRQTYVEAKFRYEKPKLPPESVKHQTKAASKVKAKELPPKEPVESEARKAHLIQLANYRDVRVIQRNLVYVIGIPAAIAVKEILSKREFFGQYGAVQHLVVNRTHSYSPQWTGPSFAVYVTYAQPDEAIKAITDVDGASYEGRILRASFGTTKYCSYFLRGQPCPNQDCFYLHHLGSEEDSFTREEMLSAKHQFYDLAFPTRLVGDIQRQHVPINKNSTFGKQHPEEIARASGTDEKAAVELGKPQKYEKVVEPEPAPSATKVSGSWASVAAGRATSSPIVEPTEAPVVVNTSQFPLPQSSDPRTNPRPTSTQPAASAPKKRKVKKKTGRSVDDEQSDHTSSLLVAKEDTNKSKNFMEEQSELQPSPADASSSSLSNFPPGLNASSVLPPAASLAGSSFAPLSTGVLFNLPPATVRLPPPPPLPPPSVQPVFFDAAFFSGPTHFAASEYLPPRLQSASSWQSYQPQSYAPTLWQPSTYSSPNAPSGIDPGNYNRVQFSDGRNESEPPSGSSMLHRLLEFDKKTRNEDQHGVVSERLGALAWLAMSDNTTHEQFHRVPNDPSYPYKQQLPVFFGVPQMSAPSGLVPVRWAEPSPAPNVFPEKLSPRADDRGLAILRSLLPHATIALAPDGRRQDADPWKPRQIPSTGWVDGPFGPVRQGESRRDERVV